LQETPMGTYWETLLFFACLGNRWEGVGTLVGNAPIPTNLPQNSFQWGGAGTSRGGGVLRKTKEKRGKERRERRGRGCFQSTIMYHVVMKIGKSSCDVLCTT